MTDTDCRCRWDGALDGKMIRCKNHGLIQRQQTRIDPTVDALAELWKKHPDLRLTQLINNLVGQDNWNVEDTVLLDRITEVNATGSFVREI